MTDPVKKDPPALDDYDDADSNAGDEVEVDENGEVIEDADA